MRWRQELEKELGGEPKRGKGKDHREEEWPQLEITENFK